MANGHGGMRTPSNPAPVSGPGALSRRTDGQPARYASGMPYGDGQDFYDVQTSAPMAKTDNAAAGVRRARESQPRMVEEPVTPLFSPTQRPEEPVTSGAALGPGPGPMTYDQPPAVNALLRAAANDPTGELDALASIVLRLGA